MFKFDVNQLIVLEIKHAQSTFLNLPLGIEVS